MITEKLQSIVIDAVQQSMDNGITLQQLLDECLHQWAEELRERLSAAEHTTVELKRK